MWALNEVKKNAAPGSDGVEIYMLLTERLFEVWVALFDVCWEHGIVPSLWRESIVSVKGGDAGTNYCLWCY